jgi:hypothetical protein
VDPFFPPVQLTSFPFNPITTTMQIFSIITGAPNMGQNRTILDTSKLGRHRHIVLVYNREGEWGGGVGG